MRSIIAHCRDAALCYTRERRYNTPSLPPKDTLDTQWSWVVGVLVWCDLVYLKPDRLSWGQPQTTSLRIIFLHSDI